MMKRIYTPLPLFFIRYILSVLESVSCCVLFSRTPIPTKVLDKERIDTRPSKFANTLLSLFRVNVLVHKAEFFAFLDAPVIVVQERMSLFWITKDF